MDRAGVDPHEELGLKADATLAQVKKAYRRLAAQWHPDRNADPQAVRRMQRINEAYRRLCERVEVMADDAEAEAPVEPDPPPQQASPPPNEHAKAKAKRKWWERDWGKPRWEPDGEAAPRPLAHEAEITLEAAALGCTHRVQGLITDLCPDCEGVGRWVSPRTLCQACDGEGRVPGTRSGSWVTCAPCGGDGHERQACASCGGSGELTSARAYHYEVRIPAGVRDGQTVILRGQGQRCGARQADLVLTIRLRVHPLFTWRADQTLSCTVPVDLFTVLAHGVVQVPTLEGHLIKLALADGAEQTLPGMGFPNKDGSRGPLHVVLQTLTPTTYSAAQQALLAKLAASIQADPLPACPELAAWQAQLRQHARR